MMIIEKIINDTPMLFKSIENEDGYLVSECGKIYSEFSGRILKQHTTYNGYKRIKIRKVKYYVHQLVVSAFIGERPIGFDSKFHIDHIDSDRTNNHVSNLRVISRRDNVYKEKNKLTGAQLNSGGRWMAQIRVNGWLQYLGMFDTAEQAHSRYKIARMMLSKSS